MINFPELSEEALFRAIITPAMRENPILPPKPWRLAWALGLRLSLSQGRLLTDQLLTYQLDAGSWGVDPLIVGLVRECEKLVRDDFDYLYAQEPDMAEDDRDFTVGSNRSSARDMGGRPVAYIQDVSNCFFHGKQARMETCVAWLMKFTPLGYGAMLHVAMAKGPDFLVAERYYWPDGFNVERAFALNRLGEQLHPCPITGKVRKEGTCTHFASRYTYGAAVVPYSPQPDEQ